MFFVFSLLSLSFFWRIPNELLCSGLVFFLVIVVFSGWLAGVRMSTLFFSSFLF